VTSLLLWLSTAAVLAVAGRVTEDKPGFFALLALLAFGALGLTLQPYGWSGLFAPFELVFGAWVFWGGVLATILALLLGKWRAMTAGR
jgi:hypothetical protein